MNNYYTYLKIIPSLNSEELELFNLFNQILALKLQILHDGPAMWLPEKDNIKEFDIVNTEEDKVNIKARLDLALKKLKKYCLIEDFQENLDLIINYQDIFFKTELIQQHAENYRMNYYSANLPVHLMKVIHFFHANGLFKKLLNLQVLDHTFSTIIIDQRSNDAYILEDLNLYSTISEGNNHFKDVLSKWGQELYSNINKKITYDHLHSTLDIKIQVEKLTKI